MRKKGGAIGAMLKKRGRRWRHAPNPLSLKTRGGGGGGWGGVAYKDRPGLPPLCRAHRTFISLLAHGSRDAVQQQDQ